MKRTATKKIAKPNELFEQFPALSKKDCKRATDAVLELQSSWRTLDRKGALKNRRCYRLGSSLEDFAVDQKRYVEQALATNPIMKENFSWLYQLVTDLLSEHLGKPVRLRHDISYPGFHIVMNDSVFGKHSAPWHIDPDSIFINWKYPLKVSDIKTFTIPVCLPPAGATLDIKDLAFSDVFGKPDEKSIIKRAKIAGRFPHKLGQIFMMNGTRFHRIGLLNPPYDKKAMRITLQGYLIPQKGHWIIHW